MSQPADAGELDRLLTPSGVDVGVAQAARPKRPPLASVELNGEDPHAEYVPVVTPGDLG